MIRSLYTAASGMKANQFYVDNISNNLTNANSTGFKKSRVEFADLMYQTIEEPGGETLEGVRKPVGIQVGLGTKLVASHKIFDQGNLLNTGNNTDLAIEGPGFFQVRHPSGQIMYSRAGAFKITADGEIATSQGFLLEPPVQVPEGATSINFTPDGQITALLPDDEDGIGDPIGQIELATFLNEGGLRSEGANLYSMTEASGIALVGRPGEGGAGSIRQQFLEASNVQMVEEMVNMIVAQRAYEVSSKAVSTSDEMLQTANQLKR